MKGQSEAHACPSELPSSRSLRASDPKPPRTPGPAGGTGAAGALDDRAAEAAQREQAGDPAVGGVAARRTPRPRRPSPGGRGRRGGRPASRRRGRRRAASRARRGRSGRGTGASTGRCWRSSRGGGRRRGATEVAAAGGDLAGDLDQRDRPLRREVQRARARPGRARRSRRAGDVAQRPRRRRASAAACPSGATIRRWITCARVDSISCSVTAQASASQGCAVRRGRSQGRRRISGPSSGSRLKRRVELARGRRRRRARGGRSRAPRSSSLDARPSRRPRLALEPGRRDRHRGDRDPAIAPQLPGADQDRAAVDVEEALVDAVRGCGRRRRASAGCGSR